MHMYLANLGAKPIVALLAFAAWALILGFSVVMSRFVLVLTGRKRPTEFPSGTQHGGDAYWRLNRAHANAVENLPIFAAIVLGGAALGVSSPRLATLSVVVVTAALVRGNTKLTVSGAVTVMPAWARADAYPSVGSAASVAVITQSPKVAKLNVPVIDPVAHTAGVFEM